MPVEAMNLAWWPKATPVVRPLCSAEGRQQRVRAGPRRGASPPALSPVPRTSEVEDFCPLLADVDLDVRPAQRQVGAALVKDERLHLGRRGGKRLQDTPGELQLLLSAPTPMWHLHLGLPRACEQGWGGQQLPRGEKGLPRTSKLLSSCSVLKFLSLRKSQSLTEESSAAVAR